MHNDLPLESQFSTSVRVVKVRSGRRTRATCPAPGCSATVRRTYCSAHAPDQTARAAAHEARVKAHRAKIEGAS
jgi:hypothetical protein